MLKSYKIYTCTNGALGLHLSRAPWDPYPWVSSIQKDSSSYQAGLRIGDCLLELNGQDVLGMKISEIAALLKNHWLNESSNHVNVVIWRNKCNSNNNSSRNNGGNATDACNNEYNNNGDDDDDDDDEDEENNAHNINQQSLQKFATCLQHIAQLLECPVCLEVIKPPGWQCCNGHVLCNNCRSRSEKCPVCRVPLGPRGRCLLSDKLFTLLADSFPCDGVRSNKNSPKDRRKCSPEFHNQPKMAIVGKHQQQQHSEQQQDKDEQQAAKRAKDFILTSLRQRRRRKISTTKSCNEGNVNGVEVTATNKQEDEENSYLSMQKQAMYDGSVVVASNRKSPVSSADYMSDDDDGGNMQQDVVAAIQQCHCVTCYKPDKLAVVNNVVATTTSTTIQPLNKYILRIPTQGQCATATATSTAVTKVNNEEKYQKNYQCPTGKLCCLKTVSVNVLLSHSTNNNLSVAATAASGATVAINEQEDRVNNNFYKPLTSEWEILAHLTEDHQLPVQQYYGVFGQRIQVHHIMPSHSPTLACLNLKGSESFDMNVEKFFIACIPLDKSGNKVAIFVYHMNTDVSNTNTTTTTTVTRSNLNADEVSNFETIIENPLTGIKWFGCAHPLTKPWSHILEKQHFLEHHVAKSHCQQQQQLYSQVNSVRGCDDDSFIFVVKRKLETKA